MNRKLLVSLLRKNIEELEIITEGFMEMNEYPLAIIKLARRKTEDIQSIVDQLTEIKVENNDVEIVTQALEIIEKNEPELNESSEPPQEVPEIIPEIIEVEDEIAEVEAEIVESELVELTPIAEELPEIKPEIPEIESATVEEINTGEPEFIITAPAVEEVPEIKPDAIEIEIPQVEVPEVTEPEFIVVAPPAQVKSEIETVDLETLVENDKSKNKTAVDFGFKEVKEEELSVLKSEVESKVRVETKSEVDFDQMIKEHEIRLKTEETRKTTIAEKIVNGNISRNEKLSRTDNSFSASLANKKIDDIKQAISIGDRFRFQRELFNGNGEDMNKTLHYINQLASYDEAMAFLKTKYKWDKDNESAEDFSQIVKRKFN
ncbi:MAG TPA: hypothetical protein P5084_03820 [Paludibacter sp.]|nr:hypothetical protein [Paludibacter sp.]